MDIQYKRLNLKQGSGSFIPMACRITLIISAVLLSGLLPNSINAAESTLTESDSVKQVVQQALDLDNGDGSRSNDSNESSSHQDGSEPKSESESKGNKQYPDDLIEYVKQEMLSDIEADTTNPTRILRAESEFAGESEGYYELKKLNAGLPPLDPPAYLETPLATLEFFSTASMQKQFGLASYALNLNSIDEPEQKNVAESLAKKLDYLLVEKDLYAFDNLPDRSDGLIEPLLGSQNPIHGIPRRSIKLGEIDYRDRTVPIFMERVKVEGKPPAWVFSSQTVMNIEALYDIHKPAGFERYFPSWLKAKLFSLAVWEIMALVMFMLLTIGLGLLLSRIVGKLIMTYTQKLKDKDESDALSLRNRSLTDFISKITVPIVVTVSFSLMFALVSGGLPKIGAIATSTRPVMWIGLVFSGLWLGIRVINFFANRYSDYQIETLTPEEFNTQRVRMTYLSVFRRVFIFVMVLGGLWVSLAEFTDLESLGTTLLTSAGIAGVVIGIAAQPTLGNIVAGFQVAVTQPIRIGDTVVVDGIWSEVEDLRYTYAVLKTWDDRRLIVPMRHFVNEIVENWSHTSTNQSTAVYLYVDYGADMDAIENKFMGLAQNHELWDEEMEPEMHITAVSEDTITVRLKVSSDGPINAWLLGCDIRRHMLAYLSKEHSYHLPTERITLAPRSPD